MVCTCMQKAKQITCDQSLKQDFLNTRLRERAPKRWSDPMRADTRLAHFTAECNTRDRLK